MVGNCPNPRWYDGRAFAKFPQGEFIYAAISREAFEDAVLAIVHDQSKCDLSQPLVLPRGRGLSD